MREENIQALFIIIDDTEKLEQVLEVLLECEIRGATIMETQGMAKVLSAPYSHFFGLQDLATQEHQHNRAIFAISSIRKRSNRQWRKLSTMFNNFEEACTGMMFVLPVSKAVGLGRKFQQHLLE